MFRWVSFAIVLLVVIGVFGETHAATATKLKIKCHVVRVRGETEYGAPYVRVQVALASDLSQIVATQIVKVKDNGRYRAVLRFPRLAGGTGLVVAIGEWDGQKVIRPALMTGGRCTNGKNPSPSPTLTPPPTWTMTPEWHIEYFYADPGVIPVGQCTTLYYWVVGAQYITLYGNGDQEEINDNPNGRVICPSGDGEPITYTLDVTYLDGRTETAETILYFSDDGGTQVPTPTPDEWHIEYFYAEPDVLVVGDCTTLYYWAVGAEEMTLTGTDGTSMTIDDNPNGRVVCPLSDGESITYTLIVTYLDGNTGFAETVVTFSSGSTPAPTPTPDSAEPHIEYFYPYPDTIPAGECTTMVYWVVGAEEITLTGTDGTHLVIDDNPNSREVCPSSDGEPVSYTLNVTYLDGSTGSAETTVWFGDMPTPVPTPTMTLPDGHIKQFFTDQFVVQPGECTTLYYWVIGAQHITLDSSDGDSQIIDDNPNARVVCPSEPVVTYTLNVTYPDGRTESADIVISYSGSTPAPTPTLAVRMETWRVTPALTYDSCDIASAREPFWATFVYEASGELVIVQYDSMVYEVSPPVTGPIVGSIFIGNTTYTLDLFFDSPVSVSAYESVAQDGCYWQYEWDAVKQ